MKKTDEFYSAEGVIVGTDLSQEWLLSWWWSHYTKYNHHPVVFIDFGMTTQMKQWCQTKGDLIRLEPADFFVKEKEEIDPSLAENWERKYGEQVWISRDAWFKKPFACLKSPFKKTLWIDLDCQIKGSVAPLFLFSDHPSQIALAKDRAASSHPNQQGLDCESRFIYNSGVISFEKGAPLIQLWAHESKKRNGFFRTDQDLLSQLIFEQSLEICELPPIYNWTIGYGENPDSVIDHWVGEIGKLVLRNQLVLNDL